MYLHNLNPTILNLGPLEIRWYGLVYVLGFLLAAYWLHKHKEKINLAKDQAWDLLFYIILGLLIGARVFMIFWQPEIYLLKPWNLIKIWEGGMSFHGGFAGAILGAYYYCRKKNLNFLTIADLISIPAIFALALGRIANFINGELVGRITSVPWAVKFSDYEGFRHPVQLYNSLANLSIFGLLWFLKDKNYKKGTLFWTFLVWYSSLRFLMGFFKEADQYGFLLGITVEQLIYLVAAVISIICLKKVR